ncbi:MAG: (d)CMP kinase [Fidelibacterota bacterium]
MGIVIAIDGPAGSGKSSTAKEVARRLNFTYVDTGAMYRAVTLLVIRQGIDIHATEKIVAAARNLDIRFRWIDNVHHTFIGDEDVTAAIRMSEVAELVSPVSAIPGVRIVMAEQQRAFARMSNIVMEGRDIGTNVFPDADLKFYMNADLHVRAQRRSRDYQKIGQSLSLDEIAGELRKRDQIDSSRTHSPLKKAEDAIVIDTTHLSFEEQVAKIVGIVQKKLNLTNNSSINNP